MVEPIRIGNHLVGPGQPCLIIAEAGVNHNGDLEIAHQLIDVAAKAKADAVKFQTYKTERVMSRYAPKASYQLETTNTNESQFEMSKKLELPDDSFRQLMEHCKEKDIMFLSSPFDNESADLLNSLRVNAFKIPSGEITNIPYLAQIARYGKAMIISTGMSNLSDVETAINTVEDAGSATYALLHCVSNYPADPSNVNLKAMATLEAAFNAPVGYSDHTKGASIAIAAVSMGACIIEKHFTLDNNMAGPDHRASLEPDELFTMVQSIRTVESAMGNGRKVPAETETNTAEVARKSIVAAQFLPAGTCLTESSMDIKRPGNGINPSMQDEIIGRTVTKDILEDEQILFENLS